MVCLKPTILPVRIHDLDAEDKNLLDHELGSVLRAIEFILIISTYPFALLSHARW